MMIAIIPAWADESGESPATGTPVSFQASIQKGETVGTDQIQRALVTAGSYQLLMVIPRGMGVETSYSDKIVLSPPGYGYFLTFRIIHDASQSAQTSSEGECRKLVLARYPGAIIREEGSMRICDKTGPSFNLTWATPGSPTRDVKVVFMASAAGLLEFSMIADDQKASDAQYNFNALLLSVRTNQAGKIEVIQYSDAS
jgi:hypothetical protein